MNLLTCIIAGQNNYLYYIGMDNKNTIIVVVKDRGPYHKDRCFDLSWAAAKHLGIIEMGVANCKVKILN